MPPVNDDFLDATELVLQVTTEPGSIYTSALQQHGSQTGLDTATGSPTTDPLAIHSTSVASNGNFSQYVLNEYEYYYLTSTAANAQNYDPGSVWYKLVHPTPAIQGGDAFTISLTNPVQADTGSWFFNMSISAWCGPADTTDPTTLTQVEAARGDSLSFYYPDAGQTVWIKVAVYRQYPYNNGTTINYLTGWDVTTSLDKRSVGEWLTSPQQEVTAGYNQRFGLLYLPGESDHPMAEYNNDYAKVNVDYARGFNAGGGFIGGEPSTNYPQNDPNAYACSFSWGRKLITYEAWTTLQWWTADGSAGGAMPGDCNGVMGNTIAAYDLDGIDNVELAAAIGGGSPFYDLSSNTTGQMAAGVIQDAHEDDTVGLGSEKYSSSWYGFPSLQIYWPNLLSYRANPYNLAPYTDDPPDAAGNLPVGIQFEPGYAVLEAVQVTPRDVVITNTQGDPYEAEWWVKPRNVDVSSDDDFGPYEKTTPAYSTANNTSANWPSELRYVSGDPQHFPNLSAQLMGTMAEGVPLSVDLTVDPFGTFFPAPGSAHPYSQIGQGFLQFMVGSTAMIYNQNPILSGTWPNIYYHWCTFRADYTIKVRPPRYRYLYPETVAWLRQNQRNDQLGNRQEARGPSARQETRTTTHTSSEQEGIRTTTRNWKGYR